MKKHSFTRFTFSRFALSFTLAQLSTVTMINAADDAKGPAGDYHHDKVIQGMLTQHGFTQDHFFPHDEKSVLIYDIKKTANYEAQRQAQLKRYKETGTDLSIAGSTLSKSLVEIGGAILYSPVALVKGAYSYLPQMPSFSKSKSTVSTTAVDVGSPVLPLKENEISLSPTSASASGSVSPVSAEGGTPAPLVATVLADATQASLVSPESPKVLAKNDTHEPEPQDSGSSRTSARPPQQIIFSFDAGSNLNYMQAIWVKYIEQKTGRPMSDLADLMVGSSVGGFFSTGLTVKNADGIPCMSGSDLEAMFTKHFEDISPRNAKWEVPANLWKGRPLYYSQNDPTNFEAFLQKHLGQATLSNARTRLLIATTNTKDNAPLMLSDVTHPTVLAWEAARAASMGTMFPAFQPKSLNPKVTLVAGGISLPDPAFEGLLFARKNALAQGQAFNPVVISLKTGIMPLVSTIPSNAGKTNSIEPIITALMSAQSKFTSSILMEVLKPGESYFPINATLPANVPMSAFAEYESMMREAATAQLDTIDEMYEQILRPKLEIGQESMSK